MKKWLYCLWLAPFWAQAQGSLQFNQVLVFTSANGQQTVPANKVWKLESYSPSQARRYTYFGNWGTANWNTTNPNPCTGATSGSTTLNYFDHSACPSANTALMINGQSVVPNSSQPIWIPSSGTVEINANPCYSGASVNVGANTPVRDNSQGTYLCGPISINAGPVNNSPVVTVIEFNIIP